MKKLNPWNNIPKSHNSTLLKIDKNLKIEFDSSTTFLAREKEEATEMFA